MSVHPIHTKNEEHEWRRMETRRARRRSSQFWGKAQEGGLEDRQEELEFRRGQTLLDETARCNPYTKRIKDKNVEKDFQLMYQHEDRVKDLQLNFSIIMLLWGLTWFLYVRVFSDSLTVVVLGAISVVLGLSVIIITLARFIRYHWLITKMVVVSTSLIGVSCSVFSALYATAEDDSEGLLIAASRQETGMLLELFQLSILFIVASGFCNLRTMEVLMIQLITSISFFSTIPYYSMFYSMHVWSFSRNLMFWFVMNLVVYLNTRTLEGHEQRTFVSNRKLQHENSSVKKAAGRLRTRMRMLESKINTEKETGDDDPAHLVKKMEEMATDGTLLQVFMKSREKNVSADVKANADEVLRKFAAMAEQNDASRKIQMAASAIEVARLWIERMNAPDVTLENAMIFLGGSCNPTTWRMDSAMPYFEAHNIQYYNPQVEEWYPALAEEEARAKENAFLLFFVIDSSTRALASVLEVTEHICRGRILVLVIENVLEGSKINGEVITEKQCKDLNRARTYLRDVADRHGVEYYTSINEGILASHSIIAAATGASAPRQMGMHDRLSTTQMIVQAQTQTQIERTSTSN